MKDFIECPHCGFLSLAGESDGGMRCHSCGKVIGGRSSRGAAAKRALRVRMLQRMFFALFYVRYFVLAGLLALFVYNYCIYTPRYRRMVGPVAVAQPYQLIRLPLTAFPYKGHKIVRVADFSVEARVLSLAWRFPAGDFARLSPVDIAVGWGFMAEEESAAMYKIHHVPAVRRLLFTVSWASGAAGMVNFHVANIHVIPAGAAVEKKLREVRVGDVVAMEGRLVNVVFPDGSYIYTSVSRRDGGDGACEVLWLEKLEIL